MVWPKSLTHKSHSQHTLTFLGLYTRTQNGAWVLLGLLKGMLQLLVMVMLSLLFEVLLSLLLLQLILSLILKLFFECHYSNQTKRTISTLTTTSDATTTTSAITTMTTSPLLTTATLTTTTWAKPRQHFRVRVIKHKNVRVCESMCVWKGERDLCVREFNHLSFQNI